MPVSGPVAVPLPPDCYPVLPRKVSPGAVVGGAAAVLGLLGAVVLTVGTTFFVLTFGGSG